MLLHQPCKPGWWHFQAARSPPDKGKVPAQRWHPKAQPAGRETRGELTWNKIIMQLNFYLYCYSNSLVQNHSRINWTIWSVLKNRTFPYYKSGKGQYAFFPVKLSRFDEKNYFLGSSGHPYFMNPFEYGKSFLDKLFPKICGTLAIHICPPPGL